MKRFYKIFASWFLCLFLVLSQFIVSLADVNSLMISSSSNALMTLELDDSDYSVMPMSSIGTVNNTVRPDDVRIQLVYIDRDNNTQVMYPSLEYRNGRFYINAPELASGEHYVYYIVYLTGSSLPSSGEYLLSYDFSSTFSFEYSATDISAVRDIKNASSLSSATSLPSSQYSGDLYINNFPIRITSLAQLNLHFYFKENFSLNNFNGNFAIQFTKSDIPDGSFTAVGDNLSTQDYENDVSSSLSDLSSSVDSMTDEISGVTEAIQNLQGAMEPHYSNVLTQLHHITEQLHAFYDQVYNNIHLPELSMLTQIKEAIENIDLQIEVDISEVKTAINNMSTAVQNKLQSTTDQITGGYDNTGITQENEKLEQSINQYDEVESGIFEDAEGFIGDFEYPSVDSLPLGIIKALAFVGSFLQGIFLCMGEFSVIITFSLTMIFVMVVVGYHRIRS